jgi:hypothetical protein
VTIPSSLPYTPDWTSYMDYKRAWAHREHDPYREARFFTQQRLGSTYWGSSAVLVDAI